MPEAPGWLPACAGLAFRKLQTTCSPISDGSPSGAMPGRRDDYACSRMAKSPRFQARSHDVKLAPDLWIAAL